MQLSHLAHVMRSQGNYPQARTLYKEGLRLSVELKDKRGTAWLLEGLAAIAAAQGRPEQAVRLMGASEASREVLGVAALGPLGPRDRSDHEQTVARARALLDASAFGALWSEGRAMTLEQAVQYSLEEDPEP